jgi:hypothetical protein
VRHDADRTRRRSHRRRSSDQTVTVPSSKFADRTGLHGATRSAGGDTANGFEFPVPDQLRPPTRLKMRADEFSDLDVRASSEEVADLDDVKVVGPDRIRDTELPECVAEMGDVATNVSDHGNSTHHMSLQ